MNHEYYQWLRDQLKQKKYDFYLSGAISSRLETFEKDFAEAEKTVRALFPPESKIFNPAKLVYTKGLRGDDLWRECMQLCIPMVMCSKNIVLLEGWEESKGACMEKSIAEIYGVHILYVEDLY